MSLIAIKHHMMHVRRATLSSLSHVFAIDSDRLRGMLSHWIHKGHLRLCKTEGCGTRCFNCPVAMREVYEWVDMPA